MLLQYLIDNKDKKMKSIKGYQYVHNLITLYKYYLFSKNRSNEIISDIKCKEINSFITTNVVKNCKIDTRMNIIILDTVEYVHSFFNNSCDDKYLVNIVNYLYNSFKDSIDNFNDTYTSNIVRIQVNVEQEQEQNKKIIINMVEQSDELPNIRYMLVNYTYDDLFDE